MSPGEEPEVKHTGKPGHRGYRMGCRCDQGCAQEGEKIRARVRANRKNKRAAALAPESFAHGITGYRVYRCRCPECAAAGALFNKEARVEQAERRLRKKAQQIEEAMALVALPAPRTVAAPMVEPMTETVDWSEFDHLRPGYNVRRRSA